MESGIWRRKVGSREGKWDLGMESGIWGWKVGSGDGKWDLGKESGIWGWKVGSGDGKGPSINYVRIFTCHLDHLLYYYTRVRGAIRMGPCRFRDWWGCLRS